MNGNEKLSNEIREATDDLIHSFKGVCDGLLRPMSEQFTRYRIAEIESKISELDKELVMVRGKILDLEKEIARRKG